MRRLLLITSLGAVFLLQGSSAWTPQVLVQTKGKAGAEQGTEEAWGARAVEPPEKDSQLMWLFMAPKLLATTGEKRQGAEALAETEDTLGRVPSPRWGPEPDHDSLHHNWPEEAQGEARPWARVLPPQQVLQGPEEDRDHIYHPKEDPWEP
ncbi:proline-rich acidic protein 1 isoform X2 [Delphinapterus leucas]|uniref:Proline-rich acidic protein 1 isoform X2 n=1 Tax=Delphinapterus leucas TaxID=9749 RepID=A0A2Y9N493_DELLE|nr:proline-rich acidic protein 1 isoform X2 [Delphinapterus leucas]